MPPRKRRIAWWMLIRRLLIVGVVLFIGAELVSRFVLGLGDPPLSMADPEIEYLFKPSQEVHRFGNRIAFNAYSMRSDDFSRTKQDPKEFRLLVLGDSVINGGAQTDQSELATQRLQDDLASALNRPVVVGNVSAGSWGPGNLLAYLNREGTFDADMIVLVLSSHDAGDVPTFAPTVGVNPAFPDRKPLLALQEVVTRYLPRYLPFLNREADTHNTHPRSADSDDGAIPALVELVGLIQAKHLPLIVVHHSEQTELLSSFRSGHKAIVDALAPFGIVPIETGPVFQDAVDAGDIPYRDNIHPNAVGQRLLAKLIEQAVLLDLADEPFLIDRPIREP